MGLTWAFTWAIGGVMIGVSSLLFPGLPWDAFFDFYDAPLPTLAIPGFIGGAIFSSVLGIAARRRRFDELSVPRFALWGALGGLLLSMVPAAMHSVGLASMDNPWQLTAILAGPFALLSAASAAGSLVLARKSGDRSPEPACSDDSPGLLPDADSSVPRSAAREQEHSRSGEPQDT